MGQIASFMKEFGMSKNEILDMPYQQFLLFNIDCPNPNYDDMKNDKNDEKFNINNDEIAETAEEELMAFGFVK